MSLLSVERKATGSYCTYLQTLVPEFAVEDLPLGRTAAMIPEFAVKDLPLAEHPDECLYVGY